MRAHRAGRLLVALALLPALPARGSATDAPPAEKRQRAVGQVASVRAMTASGTLAGAVRAAAQLAGLEVTAAGAATGPALAGVPGPISEEVGALSAAVGSAGARVLSALRVPPNELLRLMDQADRALSDVGALPGERVDAAAERRLGAVAARVRSALDRTAVHEAGLGLAVAIDAALPALRRYAASLPALGDTVPCDVAQQGPVCIGGSGSSTYTTDYALLIDLGGDDVHANSAGGAWLGNPGSVTIDLGGNDLYETTAPTAAGAFAVQGAGVLGVGVLVDAEGNDTYTATAPAKSGGVYAHGVGGGAGVGILADLTGDDSYSFSNILTPPAPGPFANASPSAQGAGDTGGVGILLDREGSDSYLVDAGSCGGCHVEPHAFGYAEIGGVGLHFDGGGSDQMTLRAVQADIAPEVAEPPAGGGVEVNAWGFGFGLVGAVGVELSGQGPTQRSIFGRTGAPASAGVEVRGFGHADRGDGFLSDAGGDDIYRADAISQDIRRLTAERGCGCDGVHAVALADQASVIGMAYAQLGGVALLDDGGGNDRYLSNASSYAEAVARDDREQLPPFPYEEELGAQAEAAVFYNNFSIVQGAAGSAGAAFLLDAAGDDVYESKAGARAVATASAFMDEATVSAKASAPGGWSLGQGQGGTGYGELRDLGGNDTYTSATTSSATADPPTQVTAGNPVSSVQGDGQGWLFDIGGLYDSFFSSPANPACTGTRGQGLWLDCGNTGGGLNQ